MLQAYQAYLGTTVRLDEEPNQADLALPRIALNPELARLREALSVSRDAQLSRRGRVLVTAWLDSLRGQQAVVIGCVDSTHQRLYHTDGRPSAHWNGEVAATAVRLRRDDGQWKVYQTTPLPRSRCRQR